MKITVLVVNTLAPNRTDLNNEHGLPTHIRRNEEQILFDTGASDALFENARHLGLDDTGHCTGMKGFGILKEVLSERLEYCGTGAQIEA